MSLEGQRTGQGRGLEQQICLTQRNSFLCVRPVPGPRLPISLASGCLRLQLPVEGLLVRGLSTESCDTGEQPGPWGIFCGANKSLTQILEGCPTQAHSLAHGHPGQATDCAEAEESGLAVAVPAPAGWVLCPSFLHLPGAFQCLPGP